nr:uncharacterized protein LOC127303857 [Lolium perenne]
MATPLSSAPPPFVPVQLDPTKDSGKDTEGTSALPEKTSGAEQAEKKAEEIATKKSKARQRDSESKGKWWPCTTTETELKNLEGEGFLQPGSWRTVPNALAPAPQDNEMVLTKALVERGFSFPPSDFFLEILKFRKPTTQSSKSSEEEGQAVSGFSPYPIDHGDSGKGASSSAPPPDQPSATFAEPTAEEYEQKVQLIHASSTLQANPQPAPSLQKRSLAERHAEVSAMMDKVWGKANVEMQELTELEDGLKVFFAKHKDVRQTTRKLHEDLRVHVLQQITEIEALRQNAENSQKAIQLLETRLREETAKHSSFDDLSAKVKVLEAENESLKAFIKESSDKENEARKELSEKHARELAELNDKLKKSQSRVTSLVAKNKVQEAEAEAIDKLIFHGSDMGAILSETKGFEQLFVRRVNHSFWYHKYDLPKGFSDAEEEEGEPEYYAEGSGSSIERSGEGSDDDSEDGSDDSDGDGSAYQESKEEDSE